MVLYLSANASGTSISATVSSTHCKLDEVLTLRVQVKNPTQASAPTPPATKIFAIRLMGRPSHSQETRIINGRVSQSESYVYSYEVRPLRQGRFKIPSFTLKDGGKTYRTKPILVNIGKSAPRKSRPLSCEVLTQRDTAFIGEPVALTLEAWVQKFRQRETGTLSAQTMWGLFDQNASTFGVFADAALNVPTVREARRRDNQGLLQEYYVYAWNITVYPKTPGPLDFGEIVIAWQYPVKLRRSLLRLHHEKSPRQLRISPKLPTLEIKPIPLADRPADYNGAIGTFTISTSAKPTQAPVGDPITLTMTIRSDQPLDGLRPPKLDQVEALTGDFEISGESLAGELYQGRKVFSQTIRALREDVTAIPSIPMSFFNPETERYETTWSKSIPVKITPAERLALANGESVTMTPSVLTPLVETTDGLRANFADIDQMLADESGGFGTGSIILLGIMPTLYVVTWFITRRSVRFREDVALRRRRQAHGNAKKRLRQAEKLGQPDQIYGLVLSYVADRCNVPAAGLTRSDAMDLLTDRNAPDDLRTALDSFLESLELSQYAGGAAMSRNETVGRARNFIDELERCDLK